jgi:hypothetical protein
MKKLSSYNVMKPIPRSEVPKDAHIVDMVYEYVIKADVITKKIDKRRARITLNGSRLKRGIHYDQTFSPVVAQRSIRAGWHICIHDGCQPICMDFESAFLNAKGDRILYCYCPEGFPCKDASGNDMIMAVEGALYGNPAAPRFWYEHLSSTIKSHGFTQCLSDPCVWVHRFNGTYFIAMAHVDDLMCFTNRPRQAAIDWFTTTVCSKYILKYTGNGSMFCGIQAEFFENGSVLLHQELYATELVTRFGFDACTPVKLPICKNVNYVKGDPTDVLLSEEKAGVFRSKLGGLHFGTNNTWVPTMFATNVASQFTHAPTVKAMDLVDQILAWLSSRRKVGIVIKKSPVKQSGYEALNPFCWVDGAFNNLQLCRSTLAYTIHTALGLLMPLCKKTDVVCTSSTEVEIIAMALAVKMMMFYHTFFGELGITFSAPSQIKEDNHACIYVMNDVGISDKTKHIQNKIWFIRSHITKDSFLITYCPTGEMLADALTKALAHDEFAKFFKAILNLKWKHF